MRFLIAWESSRCCDRYRLGACSHASHNECNCGIGGLLVLLQATIVTKSETFLLLVRLGI